MKITKRFTVLLGIHLVFLAATSAQDAKTLKAGDKAPLFTAIDDNSQQWNLKDYIGKKNIVIFFYPAAMTGGCTKQACSYRDSQAELEKENDMVIGISGDELENLKIFKNAYNLNFPLLSDKNGEIAGKYNVPVGDGSSITREVNGQEVILKRGITAKRWTYVINKKGKIIYVNHEVDAGRDSQEVLKILSAEK